MNEYDNLSDEEIDARLASIDGKLASFDASAGGEPVAHPEAPFQDERPKSIDDMTDEEIDARLSQIDTQIGRSPQQPVTAAQRRLTREERIAQNNAAIARAQSQEDPGVLDHIGEGISEGLRGAGRAVKAIGNGFVGLASGAARLAGTPIRAVSGWDGLHRIADSIDSGYDNWGADTLASEYGFDQDTNMGTIGEKIAGLSGTLGSLATGGAVANAAKLPMAVRAGGAALQKSLPWMFGNDAAVRTYDTAKQTAEANGEEFNRARALGLASVNGAIHYFGFKLFENQSLNRMLGMPQAAELAMPGFADAAREGGAKTFSGIVDGVRNGLVKHVVAERAKGALKAGGIMGVQNFLSSLPQQAAEGRDIDWYEALKAGAEGVGEGAFMEGLMGGAAILRSKASARKFTADKYFRDGYTASNGEHVPGLLHTPEGRQFVMKQNPAEQQRILDIVSHGGNVSGAELDAACLPPDMKPDELKEFAKDWRKDLADELDFAAEQESFGDNEELEGNEDVIPREQQMRNRAKVNEARDHERRLAEAEEAQRIAAEEQAADDAAVAAEEDKYREANERADAERQAEADGAEQLAREEAYRRTEGTQDAAGARGAEGAADVLHPSPDAPQGAEAALEGVQAEPPPPEVVDRPNRLRRQQPNNFRHPGDNRLRPAVPDIDQQPIRETNDETGNGADEAPAQPVAQVSGRDGRQPPPEAGARPLEGAAARAEAPDAGVVAPQASVSERAASAVRADGAKTNRGQNLRGLTYEDYGAPPNLDPETRDADPGGTGDAVGASLLRYARQHDGMLYVPRGWNAYRKALGQWKAKRARGIVDGKPRPKMKDFGITDPLADWLESVLDGNSKDTNAIRKTLFGFNPREGSNDGTLDDAPAEIQAIYDRAEEDGVPGTGRIAVAEALLEARQKYAEWAAERRDARRGKGVKQTQSAQSEQSAAEEEDGYYDFDELFAAKDAMDEEFANALGVIEGAGPTDYAILSPASLRNAAQGDTIRFDHDAEAFAFESFDPEGGVLTVTDYDVDADTETRRRYRITENSIEEITDNGHEEEGGADENRAGNEEGPAGGGGQGQGGEDFALESATAEELKAEKERQRQRDEVRRRQNAPLETGTGEVGQTLLDLGGAEGGDLFNQTQRTETNRLKNAAGEDPLAARAQPARKEGSATAAPSAENVASRATSKNDADTSNSDVAALTAKAQALAAEYAALPDVEKVSAKGRDLEQRISEAWDAVDAAERAKNAPVAAPKKTGTNTPPKSADAPQVVKTTRDGEFIRIVENGKEYEVELPDVKFPKTFTKATSKADWEAKMAEVKKIADELKKKAPFHSVINPKTGKYYANDSEVARQRRRDVAAYEESVRRATNRAFDEIGEYDDSWDEEPTNAAPKKEGATTPPKAAKPAEGGKSASGATLAEWPKGWEHGKSLDGYAKATDADISALKPGDEVAVAHTSGGSVGAKQAIFAKVRSVGREYDGNDNADVFIGDYKDGWGYDQDARFKKSEIIGIRRVAANPSSTAPTPEMRRKATAAMRILGADAGKDAAALEAELRRIEERGQTASGPGRRRAEALRDLAAYKRAVGTKEVSAEEIAEGRQRDAEQRIIEGKGDTLPSEDFYGRRQSRGNGEMPAKWTDAAKRPLERVARALRNVVTVGGKKLKVSFADRPADADGQTRKSIGGIFTDEQNPYSGVPDRLNESLQRISFDNETAADIAALRKVAERNIKAGADDTPSEYEARSLRERINKANANARARKKLAEETSFEDIKKRYLNDEKYYREEAKELREELKRLEKEGIGDDREEVDWYTNGDLLEILDSIESGEASASMHFDPYAIGQGEAGPFAEALKNLTDSGNFKGKNLERLNRVAQKINDAYKAIERDIEDPRGPFGESLRYMRNADGVTVGEYDAAKGEIRLYPGATVADVVHEFTHPLVDYARAEDRAGRGELLGKIKEIIDAERATWEEPVRDAYADKGEGEILEEIFTHAMGEKGATLFGKSTTTLEGRRWYNRLWDAIKGVWQDFATKMGWNKADLLGLDKMSPEDAAQKILSEMANGRSFGDAMTDGEGTRNAFVGTKGAERLGIGKRGDAEQMEKDGASREDIWRKTGWWRGKDGKWRVEIPDAKLPMWKIGWLENDSRVYPGREYPISSFASAKDLFAAYPELKDVRVGVRRLPTGTYAESDVQGRRIVLNDLLLRSRLHSVESTLNHELQHFIQELEHFAKGGNSFKMGYEEYARLAGETEARNIQKRLALTPEERAETPPWETEDVPENRQIVRMGGDGARNAVRKGVSAEEDAAYMDAVRRGDMETARRMVREAAARAMPNTKVVDKDGLPLVVYHGGGLQKVHAGEIYTSSDSGIAKGYGKAKALFLDIENPRIIDANGNQFDDLFGETLEGDVEYGTSTDRIVTDTMYDPESKYDGVIIRNVVDNAVGDSVPSDVYVTFNMDKTKTKSADAITRDDSGNAIPLSQRFNPQNPDIRYSRRVTPRNVPPAPTNQDIQDYLGGEDSFMRRLRRMFQDKNIVIRDVEERLGVTDKDESTYYAKDRAFGKNEHELTVLQKREVEPIVEKIHKSGGSLELFSAYLYARHSGERNAALKASKGVENGSGMTKEQADAIFKDVDRLGLRAAFEDAARDVWAMNRKYLQRRVDSGRMTQADYDFYTQRYKHYVPLRTDMTDEELDIFNSTTGGWKRNELMAAQGRKSAADDPLAFSIVQNEQAIRASNANEVRRRFAGLVRRSKGALGEVVDGVNKGGAKWSFTFGDGETVETGSPMRLASERDDIVLFKENGQLKAVKVNPGEHGRGLDLARAVTDRDVVQFNRHLEWIPRATRWMSAMRTQYVPTFIVRNMKADNLEVMLNALSERGVKDGAKFFGKFLKNEVSVAKGVKEYFKTGKSSDRFVQEAVENGLLTGGGMSAEGFTETARRLSDTLQALRERPKILGGAFEAAKDTISLLNACAEYNTRMGVYKTLREEGMSVADAVSYARDVTVNFNRKGYLTPYTNAAFMFSNAAIQGMGRAFKSMNSAHGKEVLAGMFLVGVAQALLDDWLGHDDESEKSGDADSRNLTEYDKSHSLGVALPTGHRVKTGIRNPWALPMYAGRKAVELLKGISSGEKVMKDLASEVGQFVTEPVGGNGFDSTSEFLQTIFPTIIDPFVQWGTGKDYRGQDRLKKSFDKYAPDSWNGKDSTPEAYKAVAKALNFISGGSEHRKGAFDVAPENVRLLTETVFGGVLTDLNNLVKGGEHAVDAVRGKPAAQVARDIPFVRDTFTNMPDNTSRFYAALDAYNADKAEFKKTTELGRRRDMKREKPYLTQGKGRVDGLIKRVKELRHLERGEVKAGQKWVERKTPLPEERKRRFREQRLATQARVLKMLGE